MTLTPSSNSTDTPLESDQTILDISWITFFTNSLDVFQIAIQTFILLVSQETKKDEVRWSHNESRSKYFLKEIFRYLCVCNFFKWFTDSFIEGHFLKNSEAKTLVFGEPTWTGITQSAYPLVLFYRFHSVHMLLNAIDRLF